MELGENRSCPDGGEVLIKNVLKLKGLCTNASDAKKKRIRGKASEEGREAEQ